MQIEIVDACEHRYVHPLRDTGVSTGDIKNLIPDRVQYTFVLKMPDGSHSLAEVTQETFEKYLKLT